MFTDIVGYTSLSQKNEARALALLDEHRRFLRSLFSKYNGNEIKTIGDAFLVEFPSALGAARCAFDIQRSLHEKNSNAPREKMIALLRIGIHVGEVVYEEGDIHGDAVNVASRIHSLADPGGICITQQVFDQINNKFEHHIVSMGMRELKNVELPREIYKILLPWQNTTGSELKVPLDHRRVAVLPLTNMISDPKDEYFADGMTEELISTISNISGLSVISRTSAMQYKNAAKKMFEIGRELNVGSALEGSVRKAGNRVRIAVQLIDVESDRHLWAENYDRELQDVFAIQSDIARKVAQSLEIRLLAQDMSRIDKPKTTSGEAHTLYLKGRYYWNERSEESMKKALEYFRLALKRIPITR